MKLRALPFMAPAGLDETAEGRRFLGALDRRVATFCVGRLQGKVVLYVTAPTALATEGGNVIVVLGMTSDLVAALASQLIGCLKKEDARKFLVDMIAALEANSEWA